MSEHGRSPWMSQLFAAKSATPEKSERRQWVRFVFPNLITRLSWSRGTETVTHLVTLVNVSAGGVAVTVDVKPPTDRPCMIFFENEGVSSGPIPVNLIAVVPSDSGRYLARFSFEHAEATREFIPRQKERGAWQRVIPRDAGPVSRGRLTT